MTMTAPRATSWIEPEAVGSILRCESCCIVKWFPSRDAAALAWAGHVLALHEDLLDAS